MGSGLDGRNPSYALNDIADAIAKEATEIFRLLDDAQVGTAEIKATSRRASR